MYVSYSFFLLRGISRFETPKEKVSVTLHTIERYKEYVSVKKDLIEHFLRTLAYK